MKLLKEKYIIVKSHLKIGYEKNIIHYLFFFYIHKK